MMNDNALQTALVEMTGAAAMTQGSAVTGQLAYIEKLRANGAPEEEVYAAEMAIKGGDCRSCGRPWMKVEVRSRFGGFDYFEPGCKCLADMQAARIAAENSKRTLDEAFAKAKIPKDEIQSTWENWNSKAFPNENQEVKAKINRAAQECQGFVGARKWKYGAGLILHGAPGVGKTRTAIMVLKGILALEPDLPVIFIRMADLMTMIIKSKDDDGYIGMLQKNKVVVIDDMDKIPMDKPWIATQVFNLYDALIQASVTIIGTTNLAGAGGLAEKFDGPMVSRLIGYCDLIDFGGNVDSDYRLLRKVYQLE